MKYGSITISTTSTAGSSSRSVEAEEAEEALPPGCPGRGVSGNDCGGPGAAKLETAKRALGPPLSRPNSACVTPTQLLCLLRARLSQACS